MSERLLDKESCQPPKGMVDLQSELCQELLLTHIQIFPFLFLSGLGPDRTGNRLVLEK